MDIIVSNLLEWIDTIAILVLVLVFLLTGYLMGRRAAGQSSVIEAPRFINQGSTDEPEGDLFNDALRDDRDQRISIT